MMTEDEEQRDAPPPIIGHTATFGDPATAPGPVPGAVNPNAFRDPVTGEYVAAPRPFQHPDGVEVERPPAAYTGIAPGGILNPIVMNLHQDVRMQCQSQG